MPTVVTNEFKFQEGGQNVSVSGDTWICSLMDNIVTSAENTLKDYSYWSEVSGSEVSGTGYTSGSELTSMGWFTNDTSNIQKLSAADLVFPTVSVSATGTCIWRESDGLIMGFVDFGSAQISSNANFSITWNTNGILNKI